MSDYLARLLTRAAPPDVADSRPAGEVRPAAVDSPPVEIDPFETTIIDPPTWPSTSRPNVARAPDTVAVPRAEATPEPDHSPLATAPIPSRMPTAPLQPARDPRVAPRARVETAEETPIAQALRPAPAAEPTPIGEPSPVSSPTLEPRTSGDRLAIADRFMSSVLPAALLPPPAVRIEKTREVVREIDEVPTLQPASAARPIEPPTTSYASEPDEAVTGLVIGSLSVTVVPPAVAPASGPPAPASSASRVVVVRNTGVAAPGVPSFSRFG